MRKIGEVPKIKWYRFVGDDRWYSFHTAYLDGDRDRSVVLRSERQRLPSSVCAENNINYYFMCNATEEEVEGWLQDNGQHVVAEVLEV